MKAAAYTISAPNPYYEGFFYDNKMRFIDGKARITDALAKTVKMRDGVSHDEYFFEDAEEMARHFMDTIGTERDVRGNLTERSFTVTPPLRTLEPVIDENTPNAGRTRRSRGRPGEAVRQAVVPDLPTPAGVPAGADPDVNVGVAAQTQRSRSRKQQEAVA